MTLLIIASLILSLCFLILTFMHAGNFESVNTVVSAVFFVVCVSCAVLIQSSLVEKNLLNNNCGTNFTHAEVLFANSTVKNIYESKGSCYPKYEEEQSTETNPE